MGAWHPLTMISFTWAIGCLVRQACRVAALTTRSLAIKMVITKFIQTVTAVSFAHFKDSCIYRPYGYITNFLYQRGPWSFTECLMTFGRYIGTNNVPLHRNKSFIHKTLRYKAIFCDLRLLCSAPRVYCTLPWIWSGVSCVHLKRLYQC